MAWVPFTTSSKLSMTTLIAVPTTASQTIADRGLTRSRMTGIIRRRMGSGSMRGIRMNMKDSSFDRTSRSRRFL